MDPRISIHLDREPMPIEIRPATFETKHHFASLLDKANAWQKSLGSQGWNEPFDDGWMLPRIARGELFLAYLDEIPVSTLRILREDRAYWGAREIGDSIYLHTFSVCRTRAVLGIGRAVIDEVARMGRTWGLVKFRLDCFLENAGLIAFYERNRFVSVGTIVMKDGRILNLMERPL